MIPTEDNDVTGSDDLTNCTEGPGPETATCTDPEMPAVTTWPWDWDATGGAGLTCKYGSS